MTRWRVPLVLAMLAGPCLVMADAAERYLIGVENIDYLPVHSGLGGEFRGAARDILDAFAADRGIVFDYRPLPVSRLLATFLRGELDFKFPDNPNWRKAERAGSKVYYSAPILPYTDGTLVRPERLGAGIAAVRDLATVVGFTPFAWSERIDTGRVRLSENVDFGAMIRQVRLGRVDAAYANTAVVDYQLRQRLGQPGMLAFDPDLPYSRDFYYLSSLRHPTLLVAFDRWLRRADGRAAEIARRHGLDWALNADGP